MARWMDRNRWMRNTQPEGLRELPWAIPAALPLAPSSHIAPGGTQTHHGNQGFALSGLGIFPWESTDLKRQNLGGFVPPFPWEPINGCWKLTLREASPSVFLRWHLPLRSVSSRLSNWHARDLLWPNVSGTLVDREDPHNPESLSKIQTPQAISFLQSLPETLAWIGLSWLYLPWLHSTLFCCNLYKLISLPINSLLLKSASKFPLLPTLMWNRAFLWGYGFIWSHFERKFHIFYEPQSWEMELVSLWLTIVTLEQKLLCLQTSSPALLCSTSPLLPSPASGHSPQSQGLYSSLSPPSFPSNSTIYVDGVCPTSSAAGPCLKRPLPLWSALGVT